MDSSFIAQVEADSLVSMSVRPTEYDSKNKFGKLAPTPKSSAGPKSGASLNKTPGKSLGSSISKSGTSSFGSSGKSSTSKVSSKSSRTASFFGGASGGSSATPKKTYEQASFAPKAGKSSFGIIWIPTKKRDRKKDQAYSSINDTRKDDTIRSPSMYNIMSGDSSDLHKKKDEEAALILTEQLKGPIATVASAGAGTLIAVPEGPEDLELKEKLLKNDTGDNKVAAGDSNSKEGSYLENKDSLASNPDERKEKSADKVDSVYAPAAKIPPRSTASITEEEDCANKCLYYTLQCCDCVLM